MLLGKLKYQDAMLLDMLLVMAMGQAAVFLSIW